MGEANYHRHIAVKFLEGRVREAKREKVLKGEKKKKRKDKKSGSQNIFSFIRKVTNHCDQLSLIGCPFQPGKTLARTDLT